MSKLDDFKAHQQGCVECTDNPFGWCDVGARLAEESVKEGRTRTPQKVRVVYDTSPDTPDLGRSYMNCAKCLDERPKDVTPKDWARQQVGLTVDGIQVWCTRHDVNISHMRLTVKGG